MTRLNRIRQIFFVHNPAPGAIDDPHPLLHLPHSRCVDDTPRLLRQRRMHGEIIALPHNIVDVAIKLNAILFGLFFGEEGVVSHNRHFKRHRATRDA